MRKSKKSLFLPHFCLPWGRPWGNHAKRCINAITLNVVSMEREFDAYKLSRWMYTHLTITVSQIERDIGRKSSFTHTSLHSTSTLGGFPLEYHHPVWCGKTRMAYLPEGKKISKIHLFGLTWSTNVTDGQTSHADIYSAYAYASRGKNASAY